MKIIIDTNVLVSAVLKGKQARAVIQFVLDDPDCEWIVSGEILTEYKEVLSRSKFNLTSQICSEWFEILEDCQLEKSLVQSELSLTVYKIT